MSPSNQCRIYYECVLYFYNAIFIIILPGSLIFLVYRRYYSTRNQNMFICAVLSVFSFDTRAFILDHQSNLVAAKDSMVSDGSCGYIVSSDESKNHKQTIHFVKNRTKFILQNKKETVFLSIVFSVFPFFCFGLFPMSILRALSQTNYFP